MVGVTDKRKVINNKRQENESELVGAWNVDVVAGSRLEWKPLDAKLKEKKRK